MAIVCFGDSLTFGSVGHSYIKYMDFDEKIINKGVNGDTTICMYKRLCRYLKKESHQGETYVVAIGTNDILVPFLSTVSLSWKLVFTPRISIKKCIRNVKVFEREYGKIIEAILSSGNMLVTVGIPLIQLKNFPEGRIRQYNEVIKRLSDGKGVPYVDSEQLMEETIGKGFKPYSWKFDIIHRLVEDITLPIVPVLRDRLANLRKLYLTVDGVHFSSETAQIVGEAISGEIRKGRH